MSSAPATTSIADDSAPFVADAAPVAAAAASSPVPGVPWDAHDHMTAQEVLRGLQNLFQGQMISLSSLPHMVVQAMTSLVRVTSMTGPQKQQLASQVVIYFVTLSPIPAPVKVPLLLVLPEVLPTLITMFYTLDQSATVYFTARAKSCCCK
jgi:hypothetical protein